MALKLITSPTLIYFKNQQNKNTKHKKADMLTVSDDTQCISMYVCLLWLGREGNKVIEISGKLDDI
jgi:hypothetical protein